MSEAKHLNGDRKHQITSMIMDLVKIPSYPGVLNQETKVAEYFYNLFMEKGIEAEIIPVIDGRCNIVARLKGTGGGKKLLLTGHTDTVPPYDMEEALIPIIKDNKIYGRGAVDMKGPLACMAEAMINIKDSGVKLSGDVIFAGVIDEELKSEGTIHLVKDGISADAAIVGEPTSMKICVAHRGLEWLEFHFKGKTVHGGAQKKGQNAIVMASKFIEKVSGKISQIIEGNSHHIIGKGSFNIGTIHGGSQPSTVAGECVLTIDRRWLPGESYEDILNEFKSTIAELSAEEPLFKCEMKVMDVSVMTGGYVHEAMETSINHEIVSIVNKAMVENLHREAEISAFEAWSDGGLLNTYSGIPTIVFGPGDLESAHSAVEHIDLNQVYDAVSIYEKVIKLYCS